MGFLSLLEAVPVISLTSGPELILEYNMANNHFGPATHAGAFCKTPDGFADGP